MLKRNLSSSTSSLYCTSQQWMPSLQRTRNREMNNPLLRKGCRKWMRKPCKVWTSCFKQLSILLGKKGHLLISSILLDLQTLNGVGLWGTYHNDKAAKEFITHIAGVYRDNLQKHLHKSDYFSVYCDGSTDRSGSEKEVVMVRVIEDFYPVVKYLKQVQPANTKADGILAAINGAFAYFGFSAREYKQKMIGFGSDGASVMMGARRGVIELLKVEGQADWILSVWSLAHRLELAVKDCFKGTFMDNVTETLTLIYYFYKGSAKRNKEVAEVAEIMEEHFYKPEKANGTRWVDHKLRSAAKLIANWKLIVIHLQSYIEDKSNKAEDRAKGKGILKKVMEYKLIWFLHFMRDVLNEIAKLSLLLKREDVTLPSIMIKVQSVQLALSEMMDNPGRNLQRFQEELNGADYKEHTLTHVVAQNALTQERRRITQELRDCLDSRFSSLQEPIYKSCNIFDHRNWPDEEAALVQYGRNELQVITDHFQHILNNCGCDVDAAFSEWTELKLHVIHLTSVYPLANASCERGFSTMKRVKSDWRCTLGNDTMDMLMRVKIEGPKKQADYHPRAAVNRWWMSGQRQRRPQN
ncbi:unnamed protein product [Porites lobata]|uniref:Transposase n=1 Tax=Porites lobata TaxID=104759 RepID=A0ABN8QDM1_9CNID|nr:unnamed protein product [Porites lobata]